MIFVALVAWTSGERFGLADRRSGERSHPVDDAVRVDDAELEAAVIGAGVFEHLDAAEEAADVADEDAARGARVPRGAVDLDLRLERLGAQALRAGPDVGDPAEPVLERPVRLLDHRRVESDPGHDREVLAVEASDVESAPLAAKPDRDRLLDVLRDAEIRGEQVGGAGRQDRKRRVGTCERVDAALHRPVAAPDEEELGALVTCALHLFRGVAALRHLDPERILDTLARQFPPQLGQAAAEVFPAWAITATFVILGPSSQRDSRRG